VLLIGAARSLSLRAHKPAIAFMAALVALCFCAEIYRSQFPAPAYSVPAPIYSDHGSAR
jgi:hypothetical protein